MNKDHQALIAHIKQLNVKTEAWVAEDPGNRWGGMVTDDLEHWLGYGIETVDQYDRYEVETAHWELYRDIHGIKPRWMDYKSMTVEEIQAEVDSMVKCETERREEELAEQERVERIERDALDTSIGEAIHSLGNLF